MFRKTILALAALVASTIGAAAQSPCPAIINGAVLTAAQWNVCFSNKQDVLTYPPVNRNGDSMAGRLSLFPSSNTRAGANLGVGFAPTTPTNGDIWVTATGIFVQIAGATFQLGATGSVAAIVNGGTGATSAPAARQNLNVWGDAGTPHGDTNVAIGIAERMAYTNAAFTAARVWTLPAANVTGAPYTVQVTDMAAGVTGSNTLTVQRAGSDTINGAGTSVVIAVANGSYQCTSDGVSKWSCQSTGAASAGGVATVFGRSGTVAATVGDYASYQVTNGGQGYRNRIINGNMLIDQRNEGAAYSVTASNAYSVDRWLALRGTNVSTAQKNASGGPTLAAGGANIPSFLRVQRTLSNAGTGLTNIGQIIETNNMVDLAGSPVTCSFYARAGANYSASTSQLAWLLRTGTTSNEGNTNFLSGTWTGNANPINASATLTTSWQRFSATATIATGALEMGIQFQAAWTGTAGAADYFDVTGVECEPGSGATAFENIPMAAQLAQAQRYYEKTVSQGTAPAQNNSGAGGYIGVAASTSSGAQSSVFWSFKVTKRVAPSTITTFNPFAANTGFSDAGTGNIASTISTLSDSGSVITVAGAPTAGHFLSINATVDTEL